MGYACPVCEEAQVDAEHLANHLAFTAILRSGPHESWLDETVPDWSEYGPEELGPMVADHAESVEMDIEAVEPEPHDPGEYETHRQRTGDGRLSDRDRAVLEEARELTRKMLETGADDEPDGDGGAEVDNESDGGGGAEFDNESVGDGASEVSNESNGDGGIESTDESAAEDGDTPDSETQ